MNITLVGGFFESRVAYLHMHIAVALGGLFEGTVAH